MNTYRDKNAFTLIELLVVIAIIGILASVVLSSLNSARAKANYAKVRSDMKSILLQVQMNYNETGVWLSDVSGGTNPGIENFPKPPCSKYMYDYEYLPIERPLPWSSGVAVTLRRSTSPTYVVNFMCIENLGNCPGLRDSWIAEYNLFFSGISPVLTTEDLKSINC